MNATSAASRVKMPTRELKSSSSAHCCERELAREVNAQFVCLSKRCSRLRDLRRALAASVFARASPATAAAHRLGQLVLSLGSSAASTGSCVFDSRSVVAIWILYNKTRLFRSKNSWQILINTTDHVVDMCAQLTRPDLRLTFDKFHLSAKYAGTR